MHGGVREQESYVILQLAVKYVMAVLIPPPAVVFIQSAESSFFAQSYRLKQQAIKQIIVSSHLAFSITIEAWAVKAY